MELLKRDAEVKLARHADCVARQSVVRTDVTLRDREKNSDKTMDDRFCEAG